MGVSGGVIVSPERLRDDVAAVLGVSNASVGYLCGNQHGKINMWSQKKPVHILNTDFPDRTKDWWRGTLNDCGITAKQIANYGSELKPILDNSDTLNGWAYRPPSGGAASPYRLADFIGYNHNAIPPIQNFNVTSEILENGTIIGTCLMTSGTVGSMILDDINLGGKKMSECKLGMVIFDDKGNRKGSVIGTSIYAAEFKVSALSKGTTYYAYPFLAHESRGQDAIEVANIYFTIPYTAGQSFRVVNKEEFYGFSYKLSGSYNTPESGLPSIDWTLNLLAEKQDVTVNSGTIYLRYTNNFIDDLLTAGEYSTSLKTPFTVKAGKIGSIQSGLFNRFDSNESYKLCARINTSIGIFDTEAFILKQDNGI